MSVEALSIALHHSRAKGTAKLVLLGIANHDGDGGAWPSIRTLCRYAGGLDERNVQRALAQLQRLGEVVVETQAGGSHHTPEHRRPNLYRITLRCPHDCDGSKQHRTREDTLFDRVAQTPPGGAGATPTPGAGATPTPGAGATRTIPREPTREQGSSRSVDETAREATSVDIRPAGWCRCTRGWLGEDQAGRPVPCPSCKAHLHRSYRRQFAAVEAAQQATS